MKNKFWLFSLIGLLFSLFAKNKRRPRKDKYSYMPKSSGRQSITYTTKTAPYLSYTRNDTGEWTRDGSG